MSTVVDAAVTSESDEHWMQIALEHAQRAWVDNEVPVGAVVVSEGSIIGTGSNSPIALSDPSAHAEILALRVAAGHASNYRLPEATMFVTLEPCIMCVGAIVQARLQRVVFGAHDPRAGAAGGAFELLGDTRLNHHPAVQSGVLAEQCAELLRKFFRQRR